MNWEIHEIILQSSSSEKTTKAYLKKKNSALVSTKKGVKIIERDTLAPSSPIDAG